jgi:hypothetical protein
MIFFCMAAVTIYTSCKKTDVPNKPLSPSDSATIMGFKDSTQLIKSLREISYDSATNMITDSHCWRPLVPELKGRNET